MPWKSRHAVLHYDATSPTSDKTVSSNATPQMLWDFLQSIIHKFGLDSLCLECYDGKERQGIATSFEDEEEWEPILLGQ